MCLIRTANVERAIYQLMTLHQCQNPEEGHVIIAFLVIFHLISPVAVWSLRMRARNVLTNIAYIFTKGSIIIFRVVLELHQFPNPSEGNSLRVLSARQTV
jgi:hypothetical protein